MSAKIGWDLVVEVFGEVVEDIMDLRDIESISGVTEWSTDFLNEEGWYYYSKATFVYENKKYEFEYRTHSSDNVCDSDSDVNTFKEVPRDIWIVVAVKPHYPSVHHFHSEKEARVYYGHAKDNGFVVHIAKVEEYHYDDECHGYGQEREDDIKTWDVYWS
jgi:hypothetical protein